MCGNTVSGGLSYLSDLCNREDWISYKIARPSSDIDCTVFRYHSITLVNIHTWPLSITRTGFCLGTMVEIKCDSRFREPKVIYVWFSFTSDNRKITPFSPPSLQMAAAVRDNSLHRKDNISLSNSWQNEGWRLEVVDYRFHTGYWTR